MADLTRSNLEALGKIQDTMLSALLPKREKSQREEDEKRP